MLRPVREFSKADLHLHTSRGDGMASVAQLLDYVEQAGYVTDAAAAVEAGTFDPATLAHVSARDDALGQLARVFQRMAGEVAERERVLKAAAHQLHIEIDHARVAREVAQITETDYFQALEDRARCLRGRGSPAA